MTFFKRCQGCPSNGLFHGQQSVHGLPVSINPICTKWHEFLDTTLPWPVLRTFRSRLGVKVVHQANSSCQQKHDPYQNPNTNYFQKQHVQIHSPLPHFDCLVIQKPSPCIYPASSRFVFSPRSLYCHFLWWDAAYKKALSSLAHPPPLTPRICHVVAHRSVPFSGLTLRRSSPETRLRFPGCLLHLLFRRLSGLNRPKHSRSSLNHLVFTEALPFGRGWGESGDSLANLYTLSLRKHNTSPYIKHVWHVVNILAVGENFMIVLYKRHSIF